MPRPNKDESREDFLHRYMADAESVRSYPDDKQRFAVAASLWESRNELLEASNNLGYNEEKEGAEPFGGRHLQAGVVGYPEMKHPITGRQGIAILVEKDTIDRMRPSMRGIPILNWKHAQGDYKNWIKDGKSVGIVTASQWDGADAWEHCQYFLWDREAKANARNGFRLSNAWKEDEIDWTPGVHNGVPYDGRLVAAHYTHLAIVPNPRYEGAVIYANSKGGFNAMFKLFGFGKEAPVELAKDAALEIGGKKVPLLEVVNAITAMEADKAKVATTAKDGVMGEKDTLEIGGKKYGSLEIANAIAAAEKAKAAIEPDPKKEPAKVEALNAADFQAKLDEGIKKGVDAAMEKLKGDKFFEAVNTLAKLRPALNEPQAKAGRRSEKERIAAGRTKFGKSKEKVAA